jgi:hypothetical protein
VQEVLEVPGAWVAVKIYANPAMQAVESRAARRGPVEQRVAGQAPLGDSEVAVPWPVLEEMAADQAALPEDSAAAAPLLVPAEWPADLAALPAGLLSPAPGFSVGLVPQAAESTVGRPLRASD